MNEPGMLRDLQTFIGRFVSSCEQLDILCLLAAKPEKSWSVADVFKVVQSNEQTISACLANFVTNGLVSRGPDGQYQYAPKSPELARAVIDLAKAYRERRVTVIEMIYRPSSAAPPAASSPLTGQA